MGYGGKKNQGNTEVTRFTRCLHSLNGLFYARFYCNASFFSVLSGFIVMPGFSLSATSKFPRIFTK
jgi:hypothetical protein